MLCCKRTNTVQRTMLTPPTQADAITLRAAMAASACNFDSAERVGPAAFILITSRTWRIASLSVGIQGLGHPAKSSRKGGRDQLGIVGETEWQDLDAFPTAWS
jgi:hypothetical protein